MSSSRSGGSGCAMILVGVLVVGAILWGVAIVLNVLGVLFLVGAPVVGLVVIGYGWNGVLRSRKVQRRTGELQALAADARRDLSDVQIELDYLVMTKGIGTPLTDAEQADLLRLRARVQATKEPLNAATTPHHVRDSVTAAERLRLQARRFLS